ncbi:hypothetical protein [Adhaeribacter radiodurans]|uniref:Uncharacterized protein n=1 Tax=Adhaeribacter radiodurans TaxID=2745197 RepID=A0A7L7L2R9_9BACT|nr:hypothetical protein [Adhaeribacter radiodurans]QMU27091.1 hypothetical protein HUW48_03170 [Adhaeribacter radiodurans]
MAGGPRLALSGWSKLLFHLRRNASLLGTGTLEGSPQPNWCMLLLIAAYQPNLIVFYPIRL